MMDPEERKKLGYALSLLMRIADDDYPEPEDVPSEFQGCKGYAQPADCWHDWIIDFLEGLEKGKIADWPKKVGE